MDETQDVMSSMRPAKAVQGDAAATHEDGDADDAPDDRGLTTCEVMLMLKHERRWRCYLGWCGESMEFTGDEMAAVPYRIVRHMIYDHKLSPERVVRLEPSLARHVRDFCEVTGMPKPIAEGVGPWTK